MKWHTLPDDVAAEQAAWERRHAALRANQAGMKQKDVAAFLGVSAPRARQMIVKARAEMQQRRRPPLQHALETRGYWEPKPEAYAMKEGWYARTLYAIQVCKFIATTKGTEGMSEETQAAMEDHINDLRKRAEAGDQDAIKSLAVFILIAPEKPE